MKSAIHIKPLLAAIAVISWIGVAQAQARPPSPEIPSGNPTTTTGPLKLEVVVSQPKGKPIGGLSQQHFHVSVNGKPEPIVGFQAVEGAAAHVEVILMIDTVNTGFSTVAYELSEIERFLKQNQGRLAQPISIAVLTDTGIKISPRPSTDGNELAAFLQKINIPIADYPPFHGLLGLGRKISDFRIGPPHPVYRAAEPSRPQTLNLGVARLASPVWGGGRTDRKREKTPSSIISLRFPPPCGRRALRSTVSIHWELKMRVAIRTMFYKEFTKGVRSPRNMQVGNLALQVLALDTGGKFFIPVTATAAKSRRQLGMRRLLYHRCRSTSGISLQPVSCYFCRTVDQGNVTARTLTGYYAQP